MPLLLLRKEIAMLIKKELSIFLKSKKYIAILIFLSLGFVFTIINLGNVTELSNALPFTTIYSLDFFQYFLYLIAIALSIVSFDFFYSNKSIYLQESIDAHKNGRKKVYISKLACLLIVGLAFVLIVLAVQLLIGNKIELQSHSEYFHYLVRLHLLSFFRIVMMILMGAATANFQSKRKGFTALLVFLILTSPLLVEIYHQLSRFLSLPESISKFMCVFYTNFNTDTIDIYGQNCENHMFYLVFFWIFISLFILLKNAKLNHKYATYIPLLLSGLFLFLTLLPGGPFLLNAKYAVYNNFQYYQKNEILPYEMPSFEITSYDMNLTVEKQLSAIVEVKINNKNKLTQLPFTLYHNLKVKSVKEGNTSISFIQEGDYLYIYLENPNSEITLSIEYKGILDLFPATDQGMYLTGLFPYYPIEGIHPFLKQEGQILNPITNLKQKNFHVLIKSPKKVYSNLVETNHNEFSSDSTNPIFVSGLVSAQNYKDAIVLVPPETKEATKTKLNYGIYEINELIDMGFLSQEDLNFTGMHIFITRIPHVNLRYSNKDNNYIEVNDNYMNPIGFLQQNMPDIKNREILKDLFLTLVLNQNNFAEQDIGKFETNDFIETELGLNLYARLSPAQLNKLKEDLDEETYEIALQSLKEEIYWNYTVFLFELNVMQTDTKTAFEDIYNYLINKKDKKSDIAFLQERLKEKKISFTGLEKFNLEALGEAQ